MNKFELHQGDCLEILKTLPDCSVDAVISDPPYGLSDHKPAEVVACLQAWIAGEQYQPKGRGFMGKSWDAWVPGPEVWRECLRVLKPGGHLLAFAGTRSMDLMSMAVRLAGFELRDSIGYAHDGGEAPLMSWCFGSGFPKSMDVSKQLDKMAGVEREVVGMREDFAKKMSRSDRPNTANAGGYANPQNAGQITAPATEAARQWQGWGTALKPAWEPIILARKPLSAGTVAANVLEHGTGALNIDGCRVPTETPRPAIEAFRRLENNTYGAGLGGSKAVDDTTLGRWPANLIHDGSDEVLAGFPQTAPSKSGGKAGPIGYHAGGNGADRGGHDDNGGSAARFFYCAKASRADRNSGLDSVVEVTIEWSQSLESKKWENEVRKVRLLVDTEHLHPRVIGVFGAQNNSATEWSTMLFGSGTTGQSRQASTCTTKTKTSCITPSEILSCCQSSITNASTQAALNAMDSCGSPAEIVGQSTLSITTTNARMALALGAEHAASPMQLKISASAAKSEHPTVKPTDLMAYLCRLVTPPGGTVLDPFMGSGSTGKAAMREGFRFIGCELSEEYLAIARARIKHELAKASAASVPQPQPDLFGATP